MPVSFPRSAGPYVQRIFQNSRWARTGSGTLSKSYAAEMEDTLRFYDRQGRLQPRLNRLRGNRRELFAELAEARAGRFLHDLGFAILEWEPASTTGFPGDLLVQLGQATPIFVEVKGPDWEGEFQSEMEKEEFLERKSLGKYVDGEARAASPVQIPFTVIRDNALKKFADDRPNMAVVVDDMMLSPADARGVIDGQVEAFFREPATTRLGAILFLLPEFPAGSASRYVSNFYDNAAALVPCQLPKAAVAVLGG